MGGTSLIDLIILGVGLVLLVLFSLWMWMRSRPPSLPQAYYDVSPTYSPPPPGASPVATGSFQRDDDWQQLRLDVTTPEWVRVGKPFYLVTTVRWPSSPVITPGDQWQSRSSGFRSEWKPGAASIDLIMRVSAPDFRIDGQDFQIFPVYRDDDSPALNFVLTPLREGELIVHVTLSQYLRTLSEIILEIQAQETVRGVINMPIPVMVETDVTSSIHASWEPLFNILNRAYNLNELRVLCLKMGIDYDNLSGDTLPIKSGELMSYCHRRGVLSTLVAYVMSERPNWRQLC